MSREGFPDVRRRWPFSPPARYIYQAVDAGLDPGASFLPAFRRPIRSKSLAHVFDTDDLSWLTSALTGVGAAVALVIVIALLTVAL